MLTCLFYIVVIYHTDTNFHQAEQGKETPNAFLRIITVFRVNVLKINDLNIWNVHFYLGVPTISEIISENYPIYLGIPIYFQIWFIMSKVWLIPSLINFQAYSFL